MPENTGRYHVSSAVVAVVPHMRDAVLATLLTLDNVEVHGEGNGKIVIVIDGTSTGMLGDTLTYIATLDGVIAANMVFEHVDTEETSGDEQRTDAA